MIAKASSGANNTVLLSQKSLVTGTFVSDPGVGWFEDGTTFTVTFTLTQALEEAMTNVGLGQIPGYRCGVHARTMRGNITIVSALVCGDGSYEFLA